MNQPDFQFPCGIKDAALYLGLSVSGLRKHIYQTGQLTPDRKVGQALLFEKETLDQFDRDRRPAGRPK